MEVARLDWAAGKQQAYLGEEYLKGTFMKLWEGGLFDEPRPAR